MADTLFQFQKIRRTIEYTIDQHIGKNLVVAANTLLYNALSVNKEYADVTGNLREGITVGVYKSGKLQAQFQENAKPPTRPTLASGESYNLPQYWSGAPVFGKGYVGTYGSGGESGPAEGKKFVKSYGASSDWSIVVVAPVEYAAFLESREVNVLLQTYLEAPAIVEMTLEGHAYSSTTDAIPFPQLDMPF